VKKERAYEIEPKDKNKRKNPDLREGVEQEKEKSTCGEVSDGEGGGNGNANPTNKENAEKHIRT